MRWVTLSGVLIVLSMGTANAWEAPAAKQSPETNLAEARRFGWAAIAPILENLSKSDPTKFPGLQSFSEDYAKAARSIDAKRPPNQWPAIDLEGLISRNPNFWRANFEIRPGDPGWLYVHAGFLLGAGEATRAQQILVLALQSRDLPRQMKPVLDQMLSIAEAVIADANRIVGSGIKLYDVGDKDGAIKIYHAAIKVWPENSFAHYELGLTLRAKAIETAVGQVPREGFELNSDLNPIPEVVECFARAREHDPLRWHAYQGSGPGVLNRLIAVRKSVDAWERFVVAGKPPAPDDALEDFSTSCQEAGLDELALVSRQLVIWRHRNLGVADLAFIAKSLRRLVPGPQTEAALRFLDNPKIELRAIISPEPENVTP